MPVADEIAAVIVDEQYELRDIILHQKVDICSEFLKLTEPMISYNIHSYSGRAKMDIIISYAKKKKKKKQKQNRTLVDQ